MKKMMRHPPARYAEFAKGITKLFLYDALLEGVERIISGYTGEIPPNIELIDSAEDKFRDLCTEFAATIPILK
jgi:hypothetical protein